MPNQAGGASVGLARERYPVGNTRAKIAKGIRPGAQAKAVGDDERMIALEVHQDRSPGCWGMCRGLSSTQSTGCLTQAEDESRPSIAQRITQAERWTSECGRRTFSEQCRARSSARPFRPIPWCLALTALPTVGWIQRCGRENR